MYKRLGFALLILSRFTIISHANVSLRPNYFIFIEYLQTVGGGGREGGSSEPILDAPLDLTLFILIHYPIHTVCGIAYGVVSQIFYKMYFCL